ncbi:MAG: hypothetical protein V7733_10360 [Paraglaciecola polaris]|uniref:hypothetical protein n=1 Tax=Paraglaciecola polaris TaxID=222814 RepID=UPI0030026C7D
MKAYNQKPEGLSTAQEKVWEAVYSIPFTQDQIVNRAGISRTTLRLWLLGVHEPREIFINSLFEAIEQLKSNQKTQEAQH